MKDNIEICHLSKFDAFRSNRDHVMDFKTLLKIHTNLYKFEAASPKPHKLFKKSSDLGQLENPVMVLLFENRRGENHFVCLFL